MMTHFMSLAASMFINLSLKEKVAASVNLTTRCPLQCAGCYDQSPGGVGASSKLELSDDQFMQLFYDLRNRNLRFATLVGGEPMIRKPLIVRLAEEKVFEGLWVITSGIYPMPKLPRTLYFVSIDGSESVHDTFRPLKGGKSTYYQAINHLERARSEGSPVAIHATIRAGYENEVLEIAKKFAGKCDGLVVSALTPNRQNTTKLRGINIATPRVNFEKLLVNLLQIENDFPGLLLVSPVYYRKHFTSAMISTQQPETCSTAQGTLSLDAQGQPIAQCILGPDADCSQCGCGVSGIYRAITQPWVPGYVGVSRRLFGLTRTVL
jgi:MoaA/NifB/PqqE/SkfB family radical SAM enzyme